MEDFWQFDPLSFDSLEPTPISPFFFGIQSPQATKLDPYPTSAINVSVSPTSELVLKETIPETTSPPLSSGRKLSACALCHHSKKICDRNRPCQRCVQRGQPHLCTDRIPSRKRKAALSQETSTISTTTSKSPSVYQVPPLEGETKVARFMSKSGKHSLDSEEKWIQYMAQITESYADEISQIPISKRYVKQIVFQSLINIHGPKDPIRESLDVLLKLFSPPPTLKQHQPFLVSSKHTQLVTLAQRGPPLPFLHELMSDTDIGEQTQAAICFAYEIITDTDHPRIYKKLGINVEAERLFGYSKNEFFQHYGNKHKCMLARFIAPSDWKKVIHREVKAHLRGELGWRVVTTALNKWQCPIKVVLDVRIEPNSTPEKCRTSFYFIPIPEEDHEDGEYL